MNNRKNENRGKSAYNNDELLNLVRKAKLGDELATNDIIDNFEKLIAHFANSYKTNNIHSLRMEYEDLQQEGRLAVLNAIDYFDERKNENVIGCVADFIRRHIWAVTNSTGYMMRLPENVALERSKIFKYEKMYKEINGVFPEIEETAIHTGVAKEKIEDIKTKSYNMMFSIDENYKMQNGGGDEKMSYYNVLPDTSLMTPEEMVLQKDVCNKVSEKLQVLNDIERKVVVEVYGLNNKEGKMLQDVGKEIGISKQRVSEIKKSAVAKLAIELSEYRHAV